VVYSLSRWFVRVVLRLGFSFRVEGRDHEPHDGPLLIVSNHVSDLDPLVVGAALRRRVRFMAKVELFRAPLVRWWVSSCGAFPVRRGAPDRQAFRQARTILEQGGALVMFPEGTRGAGRHDIRPAEPGAATLALRTGTAVLPIAILGTDLVLPRGARRLSRAPVHVRLGPLIPVAGEPGTLRSGAVDRAEVERLGERFMGVIAALVQNGAARERGLDSRPAQPL
jgi:1-acyl-sn-glycerol-3-phosphate acyltransferase